MNRKLRVGLIVGVGIIILFGIYHFFAVQFFAERLAGSKVKDTFMTEDAKLEHLFDLFSGVQESPRINCNGFEHTYFSRTFLCYAGAFSGPASASTSPYKNRVKDLKNLLDKNGWLVANSTELAYSPDGVSNVAYYKNIGDISCNLKISFEEVSGSVSINQYSCSKEIKLFDLNTSQGKSVV